MKCSVKVRKSKWSQEVEVESALEGGGGAVERQQWEQVLLCELLGAVLVVGHCRPCSFCPCWASGLLKAQLWGVQREGRAPGQLLFRCPGYSRWFLCLPEGALLGKELREGWTCVLVLGAHPSAAAASETWTACVCSPLHCSGQKWSLGLQINRSVCFCLTQSCRSFSPLQGNI